MERRLAATLEVDPAIGVCLAMTDWPDIVRRHGPLVWRTALRLLNHDADAADCVQRTFVAAVEVAARQTVRSWPGLLVRLATFEALEQLRRRYRPAARVAPLPDDALPNGDPDPLDDASAGELAAALRVALAGLDAIQAELFCLVALEGWSNVDAAAQLDLTANHAGVLLHRARHTLRARLRAFDPSAEVHHD